VRRAALKVKVESQIARIWVVYSEKKGGQYFKESEAWNHNEKKPVMLGSLYKKGGQDRTRSGGLFRKEGRNFWRFWSAVGEGLGGKRSEFFLEGIDFLEEIEGGGHYFSVSQGEMFLIHLGGGLFVGSFEGRSNCSEELIAFRKEVCEDRGDKGRAIRVAAINDPEKGGPAKETRLRHR